MEPGTEKDLYPEPRPIPAVSTFSAVGVISGALVTLAVLSLLGIGVSIGLRYAGHSLSDTRDLWTESNRIATATGAVIVPVIAYLWGGYTAARMGRGKGVVHGTCVWILASTVGGILVYVFSTTLVPLRIEGSIPPKFSNEIWIGGIVIVAALLGSVIGGVMGARWHRRLEWKAFHEAEKTSRQVQERPLGSPSSEFESMIRNE